MITCSRRAVTGNRNSRRRRRRLTNIVIVDTYYVLCLDLCFMFILCDFSQHLKREALCIGGLVPVKELYSVPSLLPG